MKKKLLVLVAACIFTKTGVIVSSWPRSTDTNIAESNTINNHSLQRYYELLVEKYDTDNTTLPFYWCGKKIWDGFRLVLPTVKEPYFDFVQYLERKSLLSESPLISSSFIDKMDIIGTQQKRGLIRYFINDSMSLSGQASLIALLTCPIIDSHLLKKRQNVIQFLVRNENLCKEIKQAALCIKKAEKYSFPLLKDTVDSNNVHRYIFNNHNYHDVGYRTLLREFDIDLKMLNTECLNKSSLALSCGAVGDYIARIIAFVLATIKSNKDETSNRLILYGARISLACMISGIAIQFAASSYHYACFVAQQLAQSINALKKVPRLLGSDKHIFTDVCDIASLDHFVTKQGSDALKSVIELSSKKSIKTQSMAYVFCKGRPIALWNNMHLCKDEMGAALYAFGQLEAYVRIADFYRAHQLTDAACCFAEYLQGDAPYIAMDEFWNPFIEPHNIVTNSLAIGGENRSVLVVTGPNTGGKTTAIKSLVYNILLAQTCGIVLAKKCAITPLSRIEDHLNITDDITHGVSTFQAEVLHVKKLLTTIKNLGEKEFCLIMMDEAFRGISVKEGEEISCRFAQQLSRYKNCCTVIATHYHKMGELTNCGQKHVEVLINADGSYTRTFKLKDGMSTLNIAEKILEEENIFES